MKRLFIVLITISILVCACARKEAILKIGLVADPQYANKPTAGKRHYKESVWKLEQAIDTFNHYKVDYVQTLGDVIDDDWESFNAILPVYDKLNPNIESYQLLGNHDFSVDSVRLTDLLEKLSMPDHYYSYSIKGWRFIVLDATDYAYYSNLLHLRPIDQIDHYYERTNEKPNNHRWNGAIGPQQQSWIKQQLDSADTLGEKVILFSHLPLRPQGDPHNLWNDAEIADLIEQSPNVVAFINGHNHSGAYVLKNGIHYITIAGMVDTMVSSFGILEVYGDSLVLNGYGNQQTLHLSIK